MIKKEQITFLLLSGCASNPHYVEDKKCETDTHEVQIFDVSNQRLTGYKKIFLENCKTQSSYYTTIKDNTILLPGAFFEPQDNLEELDHEDHDREIEELKFEPTQQAQYHIYDK